MVTHNRKGSRKHIPYRGNRWSHIRHPDSGDLHQTDEPQKCLIKKTNGADIQGTQNYRKLRVPF